MEESRAILTESAAAAKGSAKAPRQLVARPGRTIARLLEDSRSRRIALLLVAVWMVGLSDLSLTLTARNIEQFEESNPVAAAMVHNSSTLAAFKLALLVASSVIFLALRKYWFTEAACWFVFAVHIVLAFVWLWYFGQMS